jgi:hypothetical protein
MAKKRTARGVKKMPAMAEETKRVFGRLELPAEI